MDFFFILIILFFRDDDDDDGDEEDDGGGGGTLFSCYYYSSFTALPFYLHFLSLSLSNENNHGNGYETTKPLESMMFMTFDPDTSPHSLKQALFFG